MLRLALVNLLSVALVVGSGCASSPKESSQPQKEPETYDALHPAPRWVQYSFSEEHPILAGTAVTTTLVVAGVLIVGGIIAVWYADGHAHRT